MKQHTTIEEYDNAVYSIIEELDGFVTERELEGYTKFAQRLGKRLFGE